MKNESWVFLCEYSAADLGDALFREGKLYTTVTWLT